jgi:hypothetical protein
MAGGQDEEEPIQLGSSKQLLLPPGLGSQQASVAADPAPQPSHGAPPCGR